MAQLLSDEDVLKLTVEYMEINSRRKTEEERQDSIKLQLKTELAVRDTQKIQVGEYSVAEVLSSRSTIDAKKLLEQGVPMATVTLATTITPVSQLRVSRRQ